MKMYYYKKEKNKVFLVCIFIKIQDTEKEKSGGQIKLTLYIFAMKRQ